MGRLSTILSVLVTISASLAANVIEKDVLIIGGGAGGAHAALRLKDMGQSIVLVEKQDILGGCVDSYADPVIGNAIDFGVYSLIDYANATAFLTRLNTPLASPQRTSSSTRYVDFTTGTELTDYISPDFAAEVLTALQKYLEQCEKYEDLLVPGYWDFPARDEIPEDLLLNFGEFAVKYAIEPALPTIYSVTALGVGRPADELTMTVMQAFGGQMARSMLGLQAGFVPASRTIQDIYDAIAELLRDDVMYQTTAVSSTRTDEGVTVTVKSQKDGTETIIHASKLLMAINPILDLLEPFDLDEKEKAIFSKWEYNPIYAALVTHPSLTAANASVANFPLAVEPKNYGQTPQVPYVDKFDNLGTASNIFRALIIGNETLDSQGAKSLLQESFETLVDSGILSASDDTALDIQAFSDHGPMHLRVSAEDYRAGFVQDQYALQGYRSTWYTGGGYASQFQTVIWEYNEVLLSKMFAS